MVQRFYVLIRPIDGGKSFRLHLFDGVHDFKSVQDCVIYAQQVIPEQLRAVAREVGAEHIDVQMDREDRVAPVPVGWGREVYVETELNFTAVGRPALNEPGQGS